MSEPGEPALPVLAAPPRGQPKAAREQLDVQSFESGLLDLARVHHATVAWWHGYRRAEERFGSYCYVCERFIVTWARNWPIPQIAKQAIHDHKYIHRPGKSPRRTTTTKEAPKQ